MILISELISFIRGNDITQTIYRTISPLDTNFPVCTLTLNDSVIQQTLPDGDIGIEVMQISINCFGLNPGSADALQTTIYNKLKSLKGTAGSYSISGFYLQSRKSVDYTDDTTGKLVYGNQLVFKVTVKAN